MKGKKHTPEDANYNVLGVTDSSGTLIERYEYSAYGQRQIFTSAGANDPDCYTPTMTSQRCWDDSDLVFLPYGLNDFGHQGLMHDEETGLVYNRARMLNPMLGRFMQEEPLRYVDGITLYGNRRENCNFWSDPSGLQAEPLPIPPNEALQAGPDAIEAIAEMTDGLSKGERAALAIQKAIRTAIGAARLARLAQEKAHGCPPEPPCKNPIDISTKNLSPLDVASLTEYVCRVNAWLGKEGPQKLQGLTDAERAAKAAATAAERKANPGAYPGNLVVGHVPDTGISHMPNPTTPPPGVEPGSWLPMTPKANSTAGGAIGNPVKYGQTVDCLTIDGKKPDCK